MAADDVAVPIEISRYRVMFHDGSTVDYLAHADDSHVREYMLRNRYGFNPGAPKHKGPERIVGIADLGTVGVFIPRVEMAEVDPDA